MNADIGRLESVEMWTWRRMVTNSWLLKRAIFAAIRPQFDDNLHLSLCCFKIDWKITIFISAQ